MALNNWWRLICHLTKKPNQTKCRFLCNSWWQFAELPSSIESQLKFADFGNHFWVFNFYCIWKALKYNFQNIAFLYYILLPKYILSIHLCLITLCHKIFLFFFIQVRKCYFQNAYVKSKLKRYVFLFKLCFLWSKSV